MVSVIAYKSPKLDNLTMLGMSVQWMFELLPLEGLEKRRPVKACIMTLTKSISRVHCVNIMIMNETKPAVGLSIKSIGQVKVSLKPGRRPCPALHFTCIYLARWENIHLTTTLTYCVGGVPRPCSTLCYISRTTFFLLLHGRNMQMYDQTSLTLSHEKKPVGHFWGWQSTDL